MKNFIHKHEKSIMIVLIFFTIFLRLYRLEEVFSFNSEYNYKLWPIYRLITEKKLPLIGIEAVSYLHHVHYPPFFIYIFAPILWIGKLNPLSIEIVLTLLSGYTCFILYKLGKAYRDSLFGLTFALFYAFSFSIQRADRFIWVVGPVFFFTALFIFLLIKFFKRSQSKFIHGIVLGSILGLGVNFHYQLVVLGLACLPFVLLQEVRKKVSINFFWGCICGFIFFILPLIIFDLRHDLYNFRGVLLLTQYTKEDVLIFDRIILTTKALASIFLNIFVPVGYPSGYTINTVFPALLLTTYITFLIRIFWKKRKNTIGTLLSLYIFFLLSFGFIFYFILREKFVYYLFFIQLPLLLLIVNLLHSSLNFRYLRNFTISFIFIFLATNTYAAHTFKPHISWNQQISALEYIVTNARHKPLSLFFASSSSEEYLFLINYVAHRNNVDHKTIQIYEPWQPQNNAEYTFQPKEIKSDHQITFGNLVIQKNK